MDSLLKVIDISIGQNRSSSIKPGSHITVMIPAVPAVVSKVEYDYGTAGTAGRFQSCTGYRRQSSILRMMKNYRTVKQKESHESLRKWSFL